MAKDIKKLTCWVVSEGLAGTENQCLGVAEALGLTPVVKRINLTFPWSVFSPYLRLENAKTFSPNLTPPWPDIVIASGRKAIAAARYIKAKSKGKCFTVFLQDPRINPKHFDLVAVPFHDKTRGQNVIVTNGSPNRITLERLAEAKEQFADQFKDLKEPRVAVLIGGDSKDYKLTTERTEQICKQLNDLDASLMVTKSRRTPVESQNIIQKELSKPKNFMWDEKSENPYFGMLAWADYILVTEESTSMISDSATTGKPVYTIPIEGGSDKFNFFHKNLTEQGIIRPFEGVLEHWDFAPLREAQGIADVIKTRIKL